MATKKAAAKTATKTSAAKGDNLGREGTLARFMSEQIMKGLDNETVSRACAKKFPKKESTTAKHVSWQRFNLGRRGVKVPAVKE